MDDATVQAIARYTQICEVWWLKERSEISRRPCLRIILAAPSG